MWRFGQIAFGDVFFSARRFGKMTFQHNNDSVKWHFGKIDVPTNDISWKWRSAIRLFGKITFGWTTILKNVVRHYKMFVLRIFGQIASDDFFSTRRFGKMTFQQNNDSVKWNFRKVMWLPKNDITDVLWGWP